MDLAAVPVLDQHCHALLRDGAVVDPTAYASFFTESGDPAMHARHVPESVFYRWAMRELAALLGCAPSAEAVIAARRRVIRGGGHFVNMTHIGDYNRCVVEFLVNTTRPWSERALGSV